MNILKVVLLGMTLVIITFTVTAFAIDGPDLLTHYSSAILSMGWQGQFNVDFACYLILSGIWMSWRTGFTRRGIILGVVAPVWGILFFAPYLVYLAKTTGGDPREMLLGVHV